MLLDGRHQRFPSLLYASVGAEAAAIRPIQQAAAVPCVRDVFTEEHMELVSWDLRGRLGCARVNGWNRVDMGEIQM